MPLLAVPETPETVPEVQENRRFNSASRYTENYRQRSMSQKGYVDFKALGIENLCLQCGNNNHKASNCNIDFKKLSCNLCKKKGNVSRVCIQSLLKTSKLDSVESCFNANSQNCQVNQSTLQPDYGIHNMDCDKVDLFEMTPDVDKYLIAVNINCKRQRYLTQVT